MSERPEPDISLCKENHDDFFEEAIPLWNNLVSGEIGSKSCVGKNCKIKIRFVKGKVRWNSHLCRAILMDLRFLKDPMRSLLIRPLSSHDVCCIACIRSVPSSPSLSLSSSPQPLLPYSLSFVF